MSKTSSNLVKYVKKALNENWGYCLGTYGQILTPTVLRAKQRQGGGVGAYNTKHNAYLRRFLNKNVSDCYGLVKGFLWTNNGVLRYDGRTDRNQEMAYRAAKEKGRLNTIPEIPGVVLWMKGHAGVYIGNGEFIEIAGAPRGMVKGRISNGRVVKGSPFTHWFKDTYIDYGKGTSTPAPNKEYLQIGDVDLKVRQLQQDLKDKGYSLAVDGSFGLGTKDAVMKFQKDNGLTVDGIAGKATLAELKKKPTSRPNPVPTPVAPKWFGIGSRHNNKKDVQKLQQDLVKLGFSVGSYGTNGVMGNDTANAIKDFQRKYGLKVDGQAGLTTLARIEKELNSSAPTPTPTTNIWYGINSKHNTKAGVQKLQKDLVKLGFSVGSWGTNGVMGNDTAGAIKSFQRKYGLTVDGQAGPATLARIKQVLNTPAQEPQIKVDGLLGPATIRAIQRKVGTPVDGVISKPSAMVRKLQAMAGAKVDGYWGTNTTRALQKYFGTPIDGVISRPSTLIKAMQRWANR